jgi:(5-formylfuran-3-yl)methyl phosphate synthase
LSERAPLLLVSVRDALEAREAMEGGADIIDVKEPARGSLGAADPEVLSEIAQEVGTQRPLSAALGELIASSQSFPPRDALRGYRWLKFGMSGCSRSSSWRVKWNSLPTQFKERQLVAAAYADFESAGCLSPLELATALHLSGGIFLIDTYVKDGRSIFDVMPTREVSALRELLHTWGAKLALAGSLRACDAERIARCQPDIVGIRGAACLDGRTSRVVASKVREFRESIHNASSTNPSGLQVTR